VSLPAEVRGEAERQAKQIALATFESRIMIDDLRKRAQGAQMRARYAEEYASALGRAGLERVELIDRFPVLTAQFGFTRGGTSPGEGRLRTYRDRNSDYSVYGELAQTEALFIRLDPLQVHTWLTSRGLKVGGAKDARGAAAAIISAMGSPDVPGVLSLPVTQLVHSFSHALIKRAAVYAGIDRNALSELVLPTALSFFVYAAARGDFVLGGLQALFESDLHHLLSGLVEDEHRCALDPGCEDTGAACAVCLHLGEPSCRMFNTALSRKALAGGTGYFDLTAGSQTS
jgi:hypothetical protein